MDRAWVSEGEAHLDLFPEDDSDARAAGLRRVRSLPREMVGMSRRAQGIPPRKPQWKTVRAGNRHEWYALLDAAMDQVKPTLELAAAIQALRRSQPKPRWTKEQLRAHCRRIAPLGHQALAAKYTEDELYAMAQHRGRVTAQKRWGTPLPSLSEREEIQRTVLAVALGGGAQAAESQPRSANGHSRSAPRPNQVAQRSVAG